MGLAFWANFLFAIGLIVANAPEGLLPTVTLALAMATQRMAKRNALIRRLPAAETLGAATVIVTDNTGTLTENRMSALRACFAVGARELPRLEPAEAAALAPFFNRARHCHNLREVTEKGRERLLGDPMKVALLDMARRAFPAARIARDDEIPFDADRRRMSTLHRLRAGLVLRCAPRPRAEAEDLGRGYAARGRRSPRANVSNGHARVLAFGREEDARLSVSGAADDRARDECRRNLQSVLS